MTDDRDYLAAAHVLGVLENAEAAEAEALLECDPQFRRAVATWEARLMPLLEISQPQEPPADMWQRISAALDREPPVAQRQADAAAAWAVLAPGVRIKPIWADERTGASSAIVRMDPGSTIDAHDHIQEEACIVLQGSVTIDDRTYQAGAMHVAPSGSRHRTVVSAHGAVMLLRWGAIAA